MFFAANLIQLGDAEKEGLVENTNSFMVSIDHFAESFFCVEMNKTNSHLAGLSRM